MHIDNRYWCHCQGQCSCQVAQAGCGGSGAASGGRRPVPAPGLSSWHFMAEIKQNLSLAKVRGSAGEHSEAVGGLYDISNRERMGLTEFEAVKKMYDGVRELIRMESELWGRGELGCRCSHVKWKRLIFWENQNTFISNPRSISLQKKLLSDSNLSNYFHLTDFRLRHK